MHAHNTRVPDASAMPMRAHPPLPPLFSLSLRCRRYVRLVLRCRRVFAAPPPCAASATWPRAPLPLFCPQVNTSAFERMVQRMAPRKKVSATKIRLALKHAVRNGVDLSAITTGSQEIVLEELLLALARGNSTASVVEKFKAVDAATRVQLLGKRQPVVPDVVVVEVRLTARPCCDSFGSRVSTFVRPPPLSARPVAGAQGDAGQVDEVAGALQVVAQAVAVAGQP